MATFAGLRGTGSFGTDERPKDYREMILWMNANGTAPLFALTSKMRTEACSDPEFSWWEESLQPVRLQHNNGSNMAAGATAVIVDNALDTANSGEYDATILRVGDVLQVEKSTEAADYSSYELVRVTAVTDGQNFTVSRGFAGTTAATINNNEWFLRVGSAFGEGSAAASTGTANPTKYLNYTQIFKKSFEITGTAMATKYRTGDAWANDRRRNLFQHSANIEQAFLFGVPDEDTSGSQPIRSMGGLRSMITSHRKVYTADPTIDSLIADFAPVFDYEANGAGDERISYCGNGFINYLNKLVAGDSSTRINYNGIINVYGQKLMSFQFPQGTIAFKTHPLMNLHEQYTYSAFVINPRGLIYRPLRGRDTKFEDNIQTPGDDRRQAQWLTECSLELQHERTFAYVGGVKDWP